MKVMQKGSIGIRLREIRKFLKFNQDEFAEELGMHVRTYQNYESGAREPPADALQALTGLGFDVNWVLNGLGEMLRKPGVAENQRHLTGLPAAGYVTVPRYDIDGSCGPGRVWDTEEVVDYMAFREDWVRRVLRADPRKLALIGASGDSMEPTIRAGDLLLVDTSVETILDDAIYTVVVGDRLVVKRLQRFFNGAVAVKSDNPAYEAETLGPEEAATLRVAGRIRWIGRLL